MPWYERLAHWLARRGRMRLIMDHQQPLEPYLARFYLLGNRWHRWFTVVLHRFMRGDRDGLHTHPWPFLTLILSGGYWETLPSGRYWRRPGHISVRGPLSCHRVELDPSRGPVWTLFIMGPRVHSWGFFLENPRRWVDHRKHLGET
jgi:hypothetical protein